MLALCALPDGRLLSGVGDGAIHVWRCTQAAPGAAESPFAHESTASVQTVVRGLAPFGGGFAQVGNDGVLRTFKLAPVGEATPPVLQLTSASVGCYLFCVVNATPPGLAREQLAVGGDDGVVRLWALSAASASGGAALECIHMLRTPGEVFGLALLPTGDLAAACDAAGAFVFTRRPGHAAPPLGRSLGTCRRGGRE